MNRIYFKDQGQNLLWVDVQPVEDGSGFYRIIEVSPKCDAKQRQYWLRHSIINMEDLKPGAHPRISAGPEDHVRPMTLKVKRIEEIKFSGLPPWTAESRFRTQVKSKQ